MSNKHKAETPKTSILEGNADRVVLGLIILCFVVFAVHHIIAYDFWWQLKTGQLMRASGLPETDPFSYGFPNLPWTEIRWGYCVVISLIYDWFGTDPLIIAKVLWLSIGGFCLWLIGKGEFKWALNLGLLSALLLMHQRMMIRPELVTYVLLAAYLLLIRRFQVTEKFHWLLALPVLQILWVNLHSLYIIGPIVVWIFAVAELIDQIFIRPGNREVTDRLSSTNLKRLFLIAIAVSLACLVNPYGTRGALYAFQVFGQMQSDNALSGLITELRSPFSAAGFNLPFVSYCVVAAVSAIGFVLRRRTVSLGWFAIWGAFLYLFLDSERNNALFGIAACASIIINFGSLPARPFLIWSARAACAAFALAMIPMIVSNYYYRSIDPDRKFGFGVAERRFPIRSMEFVKEQGLPRPVLTGMAESSYVMFNQGPKSVFVDGRGEVYSAKNIAEGVKTFSTGEGLLETTTRLNVFTVIANIENDNVLVTKLINDPAWTCVYYDDSHIIFLRNAPETADFIARLQIDWQNPNPIRVEPPHGLTSNGFLTSVFPSVGNSAPSRALGRLFLIGGNTASAQKSLEDALLQWPADPQVCFPLGVIYRAQKREGEARKLLARVPDEMLKQHNNLVFAATMYETNNNNMAAAADAWLQVATLGDRSPAVYQHLAQAAVTAEKWDAAYIAFEAMSKTQPNDIEMLNNLGATADKLNKKPEAVAALERSLQLNPAQAEIAAELGLIKLKLGDRDGARQAFEKSVAADPSFEPAVKYLEKMRAAQSK
ncbi:MAG: tetratricopeptide repeat protein [Pyrinomonadaceae bacterium]